MTTQRVTVNLTDGTETTYDNVVKHPWTHRNTLVIDQGGETLTYVPLANVTDWTASRPADRPAVAQILAEVMA